MTNGASNPELATRNPVLSSGAFGRVRDRVASEETMTVAGAIYRSLFLLAIVAATGWVAADATLEGWRYANTALIVGAIGGLVVALVTVFVPRLAPFTSPVYAVLEGVVVGVISAYLNQEFEGIVLQAVGLTAAVFFAMLIAYRTGLIKVTARFRMVVVGATLGIMGFYVVTLLLSLFGVDTSVVLSSGWLALVISVVIVIVAALNLALDFDFFEAGEREGAPKRMEWYAAFGIVVTLVWLYLEILRLLAIARGR